jgi:hypothetical protein
VKHLGIILIDLDADDADGARATLERLAQQARHRTTVDGTASVRGIGVELISDASAADLRAAMGRT